MSQDNQIIGFVKWLLKWFLIVILGLVLLALVIWGIFAAYEYLTNDRHLKNIEVRIFNGTDINIGEFLNKYPAVDKQKLIKIYLQDGPEKFYEARDLILSDLPDLESMMARQALGLYMFQQLEKEGKDLLPEPLTICTNEAPFFIGYINKTPNVIKFISIDLTATLPNRSTNILDWNAEFESDFITAPGKYYGECIAVPVKEEYKHDYNLKNAVYKSEITAVRFRND